MSTPIFPNIMPDRSSGYKKEYRSLEASFGDGYGQVAQDGINSTVLVWDMSFEDYPDSMTDVILDFLDGVKSHVIFEWTPPGESSAKRWRVIGEVTVSSLNFRSKTVKFSMRQVYI